MDAALQTERPAGEAERLLAALAQDFAWLEGYALERKAAAEELVRLRLAEALVTNQHGPFLRGDRGGPLQFAGQEVGWSFYKNVLTYTTDGGKRWANATLAFPAEVRAFSLPSPQRGYVVGDHGMIYRYRIVPVETTVKGMIEAPMMPAK